MNLSPLFERQRLLDAPYSDVEDRLSKDILWLMEELGELAREWRGHKYRRDDQIPRTRQRIPGVKTINPLLEEYTDCLSIILSIGLQLDFPYQNGEYEVATGTPTPLWDFLDVYEFCGSLIVSATSCYKKIDNAIQDYADLIKYFVVDLSYSLGFTWEQIEANYLAKVEANALRNC